MFPLFHRIPSLQVLFLVFNVFIIHVVSNVVKLIFKIVLIQYDIFFLQFWKQKVFVEINWYLYWKKLSFLTTLLLEIGWDKLLNCFIMCNDLQSIIEVCFVPFYFTFAYINYMIFKNFVSGMNLRATWNCWWGTSTSILWTT